jgi:hypothetical protein
MIQAGKTNNKLNNLYKESISLELNGWTFT